MASGCKVHDIGLAVTPMAYFAQFELDVPCVAMVTASHNDNGWTGVKMGANRPLTFGPDEMTRLKEIVLGAAFSNRGRRRLPVPSRIFRRAISPISPTGRSSKRQLKVVVACGNGTAGAFAPQVLEAIGCEVVPLDCRTRPHLPELQSRTRKTWRCCTRSATRCSPQGRCRPRLRRRRRPLRRGRQQGRGDFRRQGRRHAGARHVGASTGTRSSWST